MKLLPLHSQIYAKLIGYALRSAGHQQDKELLQQLQMFHFYDVYDTDGICVPESYVFVYGCLGCFNSADLFESLLKPSAWNSKIITGNDLQSSCESKGFKAFVITKCSLHIHVILPRYFSSFHFVWL